MDHNSDYYPYAIDQAGKMLQQKRFETMQHFFANIKS